MAASSPIARSPLKTFMRVVPHLMGHSPIGHSIGVVAEHFEQLGNLFAALHTSTPVARVIIAKQIYDSHRTHTPVLESKAIKLLYSNPATDGETTMFHATTKREWVESLIDKASKGDAALPARDEHDTEGTYLAHADGAVHYNFVKGATVYLIELAINEDLLASTNEEGMGTGTFYYPNTESIRPTIVNIYEVPIDDYAKECTMIPISKAIVKAFDESGNFFAEVTDRRGE